MTQPKVLHVLSSPRAEGTPRLVLDWLRSGLPLEQELLFLQPDGELKQTFEAEGCWQYYNDAFPPSVKQLSKVIRLVKRIVQARRPDVLICWNTGISPWVAIGARRGGCRKIITHAGNYPGSWTKWNSLLHTNISGWAHFFTGGRIICCSRYVMTGYKKMLFSPASVYSFVYNSIAVKKFNSDTPVAEREQFAIMVATLERHKDHATLLKAWQLLEYGGIEGELYLVGNGSLKNSLEAMKEELKLEKVHFLGSRNDVPQLLSKTKLFIFSTTSQEGFGTVLIEALASGCAIIASDVAACQEVLQHGKFGRLVKPVSPEALATAVREYQAKQQEADPQVLKPYIDQFETVFMIKAYLEQVDILLK